MMSFWESSLGKITGTEEDAFVDIAKTIPNNTKVLARIDSFTNDANEHDGRYLKVTWIVADGEFKDEKLKQKLKVYGEPKARHRALNMFKLLYNMFGLQPNHSGEPSDMDLAVFRNKIGGILVKETDPNENGRTFNYVAEVYKSNEFVPEEGQKLAVTKTAPKIHNNVHEHEDAILDDLPF